ncbi:hypothetical protein ACFLVR_04000 [Chloroflexota bacterium]
MLRKFVDDDDGYKEWVKGNRDGYVLDEDQDGYVLDVKRETRNKQFEMHQVKCDDISGAPLNRKDLTTHHIKVCADSKEELEQWNRENGGKDPSLCPKCKPWVKL